MSAAQRSIWFAHQLDDLARRYTCAEYVRIDGPLDRDTLRTAWRALRAEADVTRVEAVVEDGELWQVLSPVTTEADDLTIVDLTGAADPETEARAWMDRDLDRPVDLARAPISTFALLLLTDTRHIFYYRMHHVLVDAFAVHLIARRLAAIYTGLAAHQRTGAGAGEAEFQPLAGLIEEEAAYRSSAEFDTDRRYWTARFADRPEPMRLPASRPASDAHGAGARPFDRLRSSAPLAPADVDRLRRAAFGAGTTWQALLVAAVAAYLYRATGRTDIILGLPVTGRRTLLSRRTPAMAATTVPLRLTVRPDANLVDLTATAADALRHALRHERYRLDDLRRDLGLSPHEHAGAFLGPLLNLMPFPAGLRFGVATATTHNLAAGPTIDLTISVQGVPGGPMAIFFEANREVHDDGGLAGHRNRFMSFLAALATAPERPIGACDILTGDEHDELLTHRNDTARPVPEWTVPEAFSHRAAAQPDRIAIVDGARRWTYADLDRCSDDIAGRLATAGVGTEDVVALALPREGELIAAMLAVLKSGAAYLPVDLTYPPERIELVLTDARPACIVTDRATAIGLPRVAPHLLVDRPAGTAHRAAGRRPADPQHPAYLIYTSGSTGRPKAVVVPHGALSNFVADYRERFGVDADSRVLQFVSPSFDVAIGDIWPVLLAGGRLVLAPHGQNLSTDALLDLLRSERVTHASLPPAILGPLPPVALAHLRVLLTGGEPSSAQTVRRWSAGRRMFAVYGVTEAAVASTVSGPLRGDRRPAIGRPIANTQVYVVDDRLFLTPPGVVGELFISGDGLARGYLGQAGLTAGRFLPCPYGRPGERWYRTGDLVRWGPDSELEYVDRRDDQVKLNGHRIELGEIGSVFGRHPDVAGAVTMVREDRPGRRRLVTYVSGAPGAEPDPNALRRFAARSLPAHMVPAVVIPVADFPLTANGKVDKRALPAPPSSPRRGRRSPDVQGATADTPHRALCDLFAEVLGVDEVWPYDSFFDLGGDSIAVLRLVSRAAELGLPLTAVEVFRHPTPAGLGKLAALKEPGGPVTPGVAARRGTELVRLSPDERAWLIRAHPGLDEVLPLSPLQRGFLFHHHLAKAATDAYVAQLRLDLVGPLDTGRLRRAVDALLRRHAALRAAFRYDELAEPVQVICGDTPAQWSEVDLPAQESPEREREVERLTVAERNRPFDMAVPPLLRMLALRLGPDLHRVVLTAHHILWDGWSTGILLHDLCTLYARGDSAALPPVTPYRDYLAWLARQDQTAARDAWATALDGLAGATRISAAPAAATDASQLDRVLAADRTAALSAGARHHGITLNTVLQGAWGLMLIRLSGSDDVVFGASVSGRPPELPGVQGIVGLLTNTVPVRVRRRPGESAAAMLRRLQDEQSSLIPHHHLGLADIQRQAGIEGELFDTAMMFVNYSFDAAEWSSALAGTDAVGPRLAGFEVLDGTHYPLRLAVVPGTSLMLRLGYRPEAIRPALARRIADGLLTILNDLAHDLARGEARARH